MNTKVYAKQVNPEWQESNFYDDEIYSLDIQDGKLLIIGNNDYKEFVADSITQLFDELEEISDCVYDIVLNYPGRYYNNITEILKYYQIEKTNGKNFTPTEKSKFFKAAKQYYLGHITEEEYRLIALSIVYCGKFEATEIHGCCQREWQRIYYNTDFITEKYIEYLEIDYFNLGTEWIIHDEDSIPEDAEDINGYHLYCYGWNVDLIREEIATAEGVKPEDVVMYKHNGYIKVSDYELVA